MFQSRWSVVLILPVLLIWHSQLVSFSDGPPTGRTGAPGEQTCYNGSCHNSFTLNSGPGSTQISSNLPMTGYEPDSVYTLKAHVKQTDAARFGFQLIAFDPQQNTSSGALQLIDTAGVEIILDGNRQYIRHNDAIEAADSAQWIFEWQAPPAATGPVVFHAAFLAANNNNNRQGDYVYTTQLTAHPTSGTTSTRRLMPDLNHPRIFQHGNELWLELQLAHPTGLEVEVLDVQGKHHYQLTDHAPAGAYRHAISVSQWSAGIYLLVIRSPHSQSAQKIRIW